MVDSCAGKSLMTVPSLLGMDPEFDAEGEDIVKVQKKIEKLFEENPSVVQAGSVAEAEKMVSQHIDLLGEGTEDDVIREASRFLWRNVNGTYILRMSNNRVITIDQNMLGKFDITVHDEGATKVVRTRNDVSSALNAADNYVSERFPDAPILLSRDAGWRGHTASSGQIELLKKWHIPIPRSKSGKVQLSKGDAAVLIDKKIRGLQRNHKRWDKKKRKKTGMKTKVDNVRVGKL